MKPIKMLTAALALVGGLVVVSTTARTAPGVTLSNVLTPAKDGRVLVSTLVPKPSWAGGATWIITRPLPDASIDSTVVHTSLMQPTQLADTVWLAYPRCATYRVTVVPDTVRTTRGVLRATRDSLTVKTSLCRPLTLAERAFVDSFPAPRVVPCIDGLTPTQVQTHRVSFTTGDAVPWATVARNRYTRRVQLLDGSPDACEPARAVFEATP